MTIMPAADSQIGGQSAGIRPALYPLDQKLIARRINVSASGEAPIYATFYFEHPAATHEQGALEDERERRIELETYRGDKVKGKETVLHRANPDPANEIFFNLLFHSVKGAAYTLGNEEPDENRVLNRNDVVELDYSDPEIQELYPRKENDEPYYLYEVIPQGHKNTAVNAIFGSEFRVVPAHYRLGASRKWIVEQTGSVLSGYIIQHVCKEPLKRDMSLFRNSGYNSYNVQGLSEQNKDTVPARVTTKNLRTMMQIYRSLIHEVRGASVNGQPFDIHNDSHMRWLLANDMEGVVSVLIPFVEGDAGN